MSVAVTMPQFGNNVTEGTVVRWLKKEGEHVTADEPLLEVSTDKVDTEIPSPATGILRGVVVDEDETVEIGAKLASIESADAVAVPEPERESVLERFGRNLTQAALAGELDPVVGREREIERVMQVLLRRERRSPVLVGDVGVGKTAIVHGLAQRIARGDVPAALADAHLYVIDPIAYDMNADQVVAESQALGDVILFLDDLGVAEWLDVRSPVTVLCSMLPDIYDHFRNAPADLADEIVPVRVAPPTVEQTIQILKCRRTRYEEHHGVDITDAAVAAVAKLASERLKDTRPGKVIDLLDEAASLASLRGMTQVTGEIAAEAATGMLGESPAAATDGPKYPPAAMTDEDREIWTMA